MRSLTICTVFAALAGALAAPAASSSAISSAPMPVFTQARIIHTIINKSPYLVDKTETITWTQSPSESASASGPAATP